MDNLQEATINIEKVITKLINDPFEDLDVNDLIKNWNIIRNGVAEKLVDKGEITNDIV